MDFDLTPEQMAVRSMAREWALAEVAPVIQRYDEAHEFPRELLVSLGKTGLLGALVPEEYGGAALDYVSYALAVEELTRAEGGLSAASGPRGISGGVGADGAGLGLGRRRHEVSRGARGRSLRAQRQQGLHHQCRRFRDRGGDGGDRSPARRQRHLHLRAGQ